MSDEIDQKTRKYIEHLEDNQARLLDIIHRAKFQLNHGFGVSALRTLIEAEEAEKAISHLEST